MRSMVRTTQLKKFGSQIWIVPQMLSSKTLLVLTEPLKDAFKEVKEEKTRVTHQPQNRHKIHHCSPHLLKSAPGLVHRSPVPKFQSSDFLLSLGTHPSYEFVPKRSGETVRLLPPSFNIALRHRDPRSSSLNQSYQKNV